MNYPIWRLDWLGGATLIAIISIVHVYVAHFAVGGGLFIWLADRAAYREGSAELEAYLRRFTRFFLLLTMVFGAVTGVGIWFVIGLVSPAATSACCPARARQASSADCAPLSSGSIWTRAR